MDTKPTAIVLAVDDETYNLKIISYHLKNENYEVVTAGDGQEAWDLLVGSPEQFDTILLDRSMPRMSGMEVLRKIKSHDILKSIPVIFQTAMKHQDDILEGLQAGAYYYLTKPYKRDALRSIIDISSKRKVMITYCFIDSACKSPFTGNLFPDLRMIYS